MISESVIQPVPNELPSEFADRLGELYTKKVSSEHKKENGQFFTPIPIAKLMASFCSTGKNSLKILDPGAGTGILTCALIEYLIQNYDIEELNVVAYETDAELIDYTHAAFAFLKKWLVKRNLKFNYILLVEDFILHNSLTITNTNPGNEKYDIIITNPPYFKLSKEDHRTKAALNLVSGHANIYSIFIGIAINLLLDSGQIIFITPRSFASGNYFRAFRQHFFSTVQVNNIHLFGSRTNTFDRDKVLQETVIISAKREPLNAERKIELSSSIGLNDIISSTRNLLPTNDLVDIYSKERILHLPINEKEVGILELIDGWENRLNDFNIQISTGPVVSFRAKNFIVDYPESEHETLVPLYWLHNVNKMQINWPLSYKDKGQFIRSVPESCSLLVPNKNYIFLRRFSTKDDKSRLIASPYFCNTGSYSHIGVENKLNYIYKTNGTFEHSEMIGISALLNSELFDTYFQTFNGNVNVSATEIREMKMPSIEVIRDIGIEISNSNDYSMPYINQLINNIFEIQSIMA